MGLLTNIYSKAKKTVNDVTEQLTELVAEAKETAGGVAERVSGTSLTGLAGDLAEELATNAKGVVTGGIERAKNSLTQSTHIKGVPDPVAKILFEVIPGGDLLEFGADTRPAVSALAVLEPYMPTTQEQGGPTASEMNRYRAENPLMQDLLGGLTQEAASGAVKVLNRTGIGWVAGQALKMGVKAVKGLVNDEKEYPTVELLTDIKENLPVNGEKGAVTKDQVARLMLKAGYPNMGEVGQFTERLNAGQMDLGELTHRVGMGISIETPVMSRAAWQADIAAGNNPEPMVQTAHRTEEPPTRQPQKEALMPGVPDNIITRWGINRIPGVGSALAKTALNIQPELRALGEVDAYVPAAEGNAAPNLRDMNQYRQKNVLVRQLINGIAQDGATGVADGSGAVGGFITGMVAKKAVEMANNLANDNKQFATSTLLEEIRANLPDGDGDTSKGTVSQAQITRLMLKAGYGNLEEVPDYVAKLNTGEMQMPELIHRVGTNTSLQEPVQTRAEQAAAKLNSLDLGTAAGVLLDKGLKEQAPATSLDLSPEVAAAKPVVVEAIQHS